MTPTAAAIPSHPASLVRLAAPACAGAVQKGRIPLPLQIVICPWGISADLSGSPVIVNETTVAELAANQSKYGFDEIALDFGHNTVPPLDAQGKPLKAPEPLPIAAMGSLSVVPGEGIIFTPSSWTPEGESFYTGRHYRDLSPTVAKNSAGEVTFVHSVALTRAGQISGLHAFSANGLPTLTTLQTPTSMDTSASSLDCRSLLIDLLHLDPTATDEQIIAAMDAEKKEIPEPDEVPATGTGTETPTTTALAARMDGLERGNLVAEASRAGKIIPLSAEGIAATPITVLRELLARTKPGTVPLSAGHSTASKTPALQALSAEEATVAARLGYSTEQWRAANPA